MPRSGAVVRARLQAAAVELFLEHGFDQTTTERIATRAGVTERTYFRHFVDKREVLFDGQARLTEELTRGVADVPSALEPLPTLLRAFHAAVPMLEANRPVSEPRSRVIAATPALQERELAKTAALVVLLTGLLLDRGVDREMATLCAQVGMDTLAMATARWMDDPTEGLAAILDRAFDQLCTAVIPVSDS